MLYQQTSQKKSRIMLVYAHNLSNFDGVLLMNHLYDYGTVEPLMHNGRLISIKLKLNTTASVGKTIIFKDSILLLPLGLRKLCLAFGVTIPKGFFPFNLMNIFYTGVFPQFEYWTGIKLSEWTGLKAEHGNHIWSFREESIKYCKNDCRALHEVLTKFNELIFSKFQINIHSVLTLPALAMRIFNVHYMPENSIFKLSGRIEQAIRHSYTGGAVDVYIPHNKIGSFFSKTFRKLYYYDVNSLYPYVMANFPMPIGKPSYFEGDIRKVEPNSYGFFYCEISSPTWMKHPLLLRKIKTGSGLRAIAGLGSWSGWICSIEMDNALKYGYRFSIIKGYQFNVGDLFSKYINKMYSLRLEYKPGHPMNLIAKLLMNSLYGKFGMKMEYTRVDMFSLKNNKSILELKKLVKTVGSGIHDIIKLDNKIVIVRDIESDLLTDSDYVMEGTDVNVAIASAITAGARVHMSRFKNSDLFRLYYSDTDSIVIDTKLPDMAVGLELGQVKLEHTITKAAFLAPKVYG